MIDVKSASFLLVILAIIAFVVYILVGNTKRKLFKIGLVIAITYILLRFVAGPLVDASEDYFLGPFHNTETYTGDRYRIVETTKVIVDENYKIEKVKKSVNKTLIDDETGKYFISEEDSCCYISLGMYDSTLIAYCDFSGDRPSARYVIDNGNFVKIGEGDNRFSAWRGNIIRESVDAGMYEYTTTDGKPLTFVQKMLLDEDTLMIIIVVLSFIIAIVFTAWVSKPNKDNQQKEYHEQNEQ